MPLDEMTVYERAIDETTVNEMTGWSDYRCNDCK